MSKAKKRTLTQNRALHLLFQQWADELNGAGYDIRKTLKPSVDIPWSAYTIKEHLWRPIMKTYTDKNSTTELNSKEIDEIFDIVNRHLGKRFGLHVPFPSLDSLMFR